MQILTNELEDTYNFPMSNGVLGNVFNTGRSEILDEPLEDSRYDERIHLYGGIKPESMIAVQIRDQIPNAKSIGVLMAINKAKGAKFIADD
jgi:hypothetical protein